MKIALLTYAKLAFVVVLCCACASASTDGDGERNVTATVLPVYTVPMHANASLDSGFTSDEEDEEDIDKRIVGGEPIPITAAPWQCALIEDRLFICGCSVVGTVWVVTAAHCVYGGRNTHVFKVRAGTRFFKSGGQARVARIIVRHANYNPRTSSHDIAMIKVTKPFVYGNDLKPIKLPSSDSKERDWYVVSGWGLTHESGSFPSMGLRRVRVPQVKQEKCRRDYRTEVPITNDMICAGQSDKDACSGDSGGPMSRDGILYGVVSFGLGCARPKFAGVYSSVAHHNTWIRKVVRKYGGSLDS